MTELHLRLLKHQLNKKVIISESAILSPHGFGTPQIRKRLYMVAIKKNICRKEVFQFPKETQQKTFVKTILDKKRSVNKEILSF